MTRGRSVRANHLRATTFICAAPAATAVVFGVFARLGLRINTSPSLPIGIYVSAPAGTSDLVEFCPEEPYASIARLRHYREVGSCPDGAAPLLKPIIARTGDAVTVSPAGITVNGKLVPNTAPLKRDSDGRPLWGWPPGASTVPAGSVWVASSYSRRSFDSRYFGPISAASIRNHLRPLLTQ